MTNQQVAKELFEISQQAFSDGSPWNVKQFEDFFISNYHHVFLEKEQNQVIGFVLLSALFEEAEIELIGVRKENQGSGIGKKLMNQVKDFVAAHGVESVFIEVRESNHSAQHFYLSQGFEEIGRRKKYYQKPQEDGLIWQLKL